MEQAVQAIQVSNHFHNNLLQLFQKKKNAGSMDGQKKIIDLLKFISSTIFFSILSVIILWFQTKILVKSFSQMVASLMAEGF